MDPLFGKRKTQLYFNIGLCVYNNNNVLNFYPSQDKVDPLFGKLDPLFGKQKTQLYFNVDLCVFSNNNVLNFYPSQDKVDPLFGKSKLII